MAARVLAERGWDVERAITEVRRVRPGAWTRLHRFSKRGPTRGCVFSSDGIQDVVFNLPVEPTSAPALAWRAFSCLSGGRDGRDGDASIVVGSFAKLAIQGTSSPPTHPVRRQTTQHHESRW